MLHSSRSPRGAGGSGQPSVAVGRPSSGLPWCSPSSYLVRTCLECGLSRIRDYGPIPVSPKGGSDIDAADQSPVRLLRQDVVEACLALPAVGALKRVEYATFGGAKEGIQKSNFVVFGETE